MSKKVATIEQIEAIKFPIIMAPFFGVMIPVRLRELNQAQIQSCGDFSLIQTFDDKVTMLSKKRGPDDILSEAIFLHKIVEAALMQPTYSEIMSMFDKDQSINKARETLKELKEKLALAPRGPQKSKLKEEINNIKIWTDYLLPEDFTGFIVSFVLGIDKSDIKKVSEKMLLNAAVLAEKGHDNPADHLDGMWPEVQKGFYIDDINKRAWQLLNDYRERHKKR